MGVGAGLYMYDVVVKSSRSLSHLLMSSGRLAAQSQTTCCIFPVPFSVESKNNGIDTRSNSNSVGFSSRDETLTRAYVHLELYYQLMVIIWTNGYCK